MTDAPATETTETPAASRRGPALMLAVLAVIVLVASGIAFVAGRSTDDRASRPKLALTAGAGSSSADGARNSLVVNARFHYVVDGTLANLPTDAKVFKLVGPPVDATSVTAWAKTLQVDGPTKPVTDGSTPGWTVTGTTGVLSVGENAGSWYFGFQAGELGGAGVSGSSPGAESGSGSSTNPDSGSGSLSTDGRPSSLTPTDRPQDLPSDADARRIGEQTLHDLGVLDGDWEYEVRDGGSVGIAVSCAVGESCTDVPSETYVVSRAFIAHRVIDGHRIDGLEWNVDLGDHSAINSVSGTLANIEAVGDYPLRSTSAAIDGIRNGSGFPGPVPMGAPDTAIGVPECGPDVDCAAPMPICPDPCPAQDITITITDVALGSQLWIGGDPASPISYLVPTYHFTGHDDSGSAWSTDVLALGDETLATPVASR